MVEAELPPGVTEEDARRIRQNLDEGDESESGTDETESLDRRRHAERLREGSTTVGDLPSDPDSGDEADGTQTGGDTQTSGDTDSERDTKTDETAPPDTDSSGAAPVDDGGKSDGDEPTESIEVSEETGPGLEGGSEDTPLTEQAQKLEQQFVQQTPGVERDDVRVVREGDQLVTQFAPGAREELATERLELQIEEQTGVDVQPGEDFTVRQTDEGGFEAVFSETFQRERATDQLESALETQFGVDVEPGEDFTVQQADDGGYTVNLTSTGERRLGAARRRQDPDALTPESMVAQGAEFERVSREEAATQIEDALEAQYDVDVEPGEDFTVQETEGGGYAPDLTQTGVRRLGAARRRQDPDALTPESMVEQGFEFDRLSRREIEAARRRENPALLTPPSMVEQGVVFRPASVREIGAARRREDPDALTSPSQAEQTTPRELGAELRRADASLLNPPSQVQQLRAQELRRMAGPADPMNASTPTRPDALGPRQRVIAAQSIEQQLEQQTGVDLEAGRDFTLTQSDGQLQPELTAQGQAAIGAARETGQTGLDQFLEDVEKETGIDIAPGEGDVVQEGFEVPGLGTRVPGTQGLARASAFHRAGKGALPSGDQAARAASGTLESLPFAAARGGEKTADEGVARRLAQIANPAAIVLSTGEIVESTGEFGFNILATDAAPTRQARREAGERAVAQVGTAAAATGAVAATTAESLRERPFQTAGSAAAEITLLGGSGFLSPVRARSATFPLREGGQTTVRALRLETPPAAERVVGRRGRTVAGQRGRRVSRGAPEVPLGEVDFSDIGFRSDRAFEPTTQLETETLVRSARSQLPEEQVRRLDAVTDMQDVGASGRTSGDLAIRETEEVVRQARDVPAGAEAEIADALVDLDATIKGSAAVRAQFGDRVRQPRDLDIVVDDEAAARARLSEALADVDESPGDVFDFATREETPGAGEPLKFGQRAREPIKTEEGVGINPAEEELVRKSVGFFREPGAAGTPGFDIGPGPVAPGVSASRLKDIRDASVIGQELIERRFRDTSAFRPLRRRRIRQQAESLEEFRNVFNQDLLQEQARPFRRGVLEGQTQQRAIFGGPQRAQLTLVDLLPERQAGDEAITGGRREVGSVEVPEDAFGGDVSPSGRAVSEATAGFPITLPRGGSDTTVAGGATQSADRIVPSPIADAVRVGQSVSRRGSGPGAQVSRTSPRVRSNGRSTQGVPLGDPTVSRFTSPSGRSQQPDRTFVSPASTGGDMSIPLAVSATVDSPGTTTTETTSPESAVAGSGGEPSVSAGETPDRSPGGPAPASPDRPTVFDRFDSPFGGFGDPIQPRTFVSPRSPGATSPTVAPGGPFTTSPTTPPITPPTTPPSRPPRRRDDEDETEFQWVSDRRDAPEPEPEGDEIDLGVGWFNEFAQAFALGPGIREVPSQSALEDISGPAALSEQRPTATALFGSQEKQARIEAAADVFSFGDLSVLEADT